MQVSTTLNEIAVPILEVSAVNKLMSELTSVIRKLVSTHRVTRKESQYRRVFSS